MPSLDTRTEQFIQSLLIFSISCYKKMEFHLLTYYVSMKIE